jgi:hypothetical protein
MYLTDFVISFGKTWQIFYIKKLGKKKPDQNQKKQEKNSLSIMLRW